MKFKRTILLTLIFILVLTSVAFAVQQKQKMMRIKYDAKTEQEKVAVEKVDKKLNDAWDDTKQEFGINDANYAVLNYVCDLPVFSNGNYPGFTDKKSINQVLTMVDKLYVNQPKGSTIPVALVSNKMDEVMVCYKREDGTNVVKRAVLKNNEWITSEEKKAGKPVFK